MFSKKVIIIGGGPSALIAADFLAEQCKVEIYEKENNVGQKFLVAGKGGFNLTNSLTGKSLANKYSPSNFLTEAILNFDSSSTRKWLLDKGIETFIGTSGRTFSKKKYKPIQVLDAIKHSLEVKNVNIFTNCKFSGFDQKAKPVILNKSKKYFLSADYFIFGLGGASWSITGSDGKWLDQFKDFGIKTKPFQSSNCGLNINWESNILEHHIGKPLKNIAIKSGQDTFKGEAVVTKYGLEGNAVYQIIPHIRDHQDSKERNILIDLKPNNTKLDLNLKLKNQPINSSSYKKLLNLNSTKMALIKSVMCRDHFLIPNKFVEQVKNLKLRINSLRPIDEAISTVGGIYVGELNPNFSLKKYPNIFTIGEMVDWDAPTGGFLLQGCFSMGHFAARAILDSERV
jgi:uncharacterized flavoprotein (TIGR03862 family)